MNVEAERAACEILVISMAIAALPTLVIGWLVDRLISRWRARA